MSYTVVYSTAYFIIPFGYLKVNVRVLVKKKIAVEIAETPPCTKLNDSINFRHFVRLP